MESGKPKRFLRIRRRVFKSRRQKEVARSKGTQESRRILRLIWCLPLRRRQRKAGRRFAVCRGRGKLPKPSYFKGHPSQVGAGTPVLTPRERPGLTNDTFTQKAAVGMENRCPIPTARGGEMLLSKSGGAGGGWRFLVGRERKGEEVSCETILASETSKTPLQRETRRVEGNRSRPRSWSQPRPSATFPKVQ